MLVLLSNQTLKFCVCVFECGIDIILIRLYGSCLFSLSAFVKSLLFMVTKCDVITDLLSKLTPAQILVQRYCSKIISVLRSHIS